MQQACNKRATSVLVVACGLVAAAADTHQHPTNILPTNQHHALPDLEAIFFNAADSIVFMGFMAALADLIFWLIFDFFKYAFIWLAEKSVGLPACRTMSERFS